MLLGFKTTLEVFQKSFYQQSRDKDSLIESKFDELSQLYEVLKLTNDKLLSIETVFIRFSDKSSR